VRRTAAARLAATTLLACAPLAALTPASGSLAASPKPPHTPKPKPARPPEASTGGTKALAENTAELTGTVNPHGVETSYYFQYGPSTAYGSQTPSAAAGAGTLGVKVSAPLAGLQLGTVYHYRLVAMSSAGTTPGADRTFTTKQIPLRFELATKSVLATYGKPFSLAGTLTGTGGPGHQVMLQSNPFPYLASYADLGSAVSANAGGGFTLQVPGLKQNTKLRVRTLNTPPLYSQAVAVKVAVLATLTVRPTREPGLKHLSGTITPAVSGAKIVFQLLKTGRHPTPVAETSAGRPGVRTSHFSALVSVRRSGFYLALVKVPNGKLVSGSSRALYIRAPRRARKRKLHAPRHRR
jgi:hypothetical protein